MSEVERQGRIITGETRGRTGTTKSCAQQLDRSYDGDRKLERYQLRSAGWEGESLCIC